MKKSLLSVFTMVAMAAAFTACSNDDIEVPDVKNGEARSVFMKLELPTLTRSTEPPVASGTVATVSNLHVYFHDGTSILKYVNATTTTPITIANLTTGTQITDVPAAATTVTVCGNIPAGTSLPTGGTVAALKAVQLEITSQSAVADVVLSGDLELEVIDKTDGYLLCEVKNDATLGSRKSVNVPGVRINLPSLTEKDRNNILYAIEKDIDFIAHSFVRNRQDVLDIREILDAHNSDIKIIAKIENQEGVDNIDEILEVADGVMVARGDLGIEVPQERIPGIQRVLIRKCILAKKPVIVATQMLHTMINNPRPTRAEVTDIANAIYYRTDALMLSGETAYGKYPVEAVKTMTKIAAQAEKDKLEENDIRIPLDENSNDVTAFLAKQAVKATSKLKIRAIITDSYSGRTARNLAAFRGKYPVLAICYKEKTMRHLALSYGVEAIYMPELANGQQYYFAALRRLLKEGRLQPSDMVGYLSSGKAGTKTSFLEINVVEDALKHAEETVLPNNNRYL